MISCGDDAIEVERLRRERIRARNSNRRMALLQLAKAFRKMGGRSEWD